jgi:hypothetical protein
MKIEVLSAEETRQTGFTHRFVVTYADLSGLADAACAVSLHALVLGDVVRHDALVQVKTPVSGGDAGTVTCSLGVDGALTALIGDSSVVAAADTSYGPAGTVADYVAAGAKTLTANFKPGNGKALTGVTAGEVWVYATVLPVALRR